MTVGELIVELQKYAWATTVKVYAEGVPWDVYGVVKTNPGWFDQTGPCVVIDADDLLGDE